MPYKNPQQAANYYIKYYQNNKDRYRITARRNYIKNGGYAQYKHDHGLKKRMETLEFLGNKCVKCGFTDWRALQVDHIHGRGRSELKRVGYSKYLDQIVKSKNKYQLLCANCNWIKKYENNENRKNN